MVNDSKLNTRPRKQLNTKWVNNALRSVGSITKSAFNDISPNLITTYDETSQMVQSMREFTKGNFSSLLSQTLNNNKYVKGLNSAYKNALSDIKSGNLDNKDRMMESMSDSYTVGTEDEDEDESGVSINIPDNSASLNLLSTQIQKNTETQVKMVKASMDASIAVSTASMMQLEKIGGEINLHLSNIENSLSAMVQYNMNNMQKFIDSSIAYYERTGPSIESEHSKSKRLSAADVFASRTGGISLSKYKQYVMQELKDSHAGMAVGMLTDEQTIRMLLANPIGTVGSMTASALMPKVIKNTMQSVEEAYSAILPSMLDRIHRLSERTGTSITDSIVQNIGKFFGIKNTRTDKLDSSSMINKDAIPFDGITKHAITEVMTKELREQTSYLKIIASHYDKNAASSVESKTRVFDYNNGRYTTSENINKELVSSITDAITSAFNSGSFGKGMSGIYSKAMDKKISDDDLNRILNEFYAKLERSTSRISIEEFGDASLNPKKDGELNAILRSLGRKGNSSDKKVIKLLIDQLRSMQDTPIALEDFYRARFAANSSRNNAIKNIKDDPYQTNYFNSTIFNSTTPDGQTRSVDSVIDDYYKLRKVGDYNKYTDKSQNRSKPVYRHDRDSYNPNGRSYLSQNAGNNLLMASRSIMHLDFGTAFKHIGDIVVDGAKDTFNAFKTHVISPLGNLFMGDKKSDGYYEGGIMSTVNNHLKDMTKYISSAFSGKEWTDSKGKLHKLKDPSDSLLGSFKKMRDGITSNVHDLLLGKSEEDDGKPTSLVDIAVTSVRKGFEGWSEALFGKSKNGIEEEKDQIIDNIANRMPAALKGGVVGGVIGGLSGGSLLGWLVGGPVGGALIGMASGFAYKGSRFQEWLFGKDFVDEDGNTRHQRGMIPQPIIDTIKNNKSAISIGAVSGALIHSIRGGSGLLTGLVGGPIAGALMGIATSMVAKSDTFKEFLWGNEKTGQNGILTTLGSAFKSFGKKTSDGLSEQDSKMLGMTAIGMGSGALTATIVSKMGILGAAISPIGPIGGALLGLGATILAQKNDFHDWLFGKKNNKGEKIEEGVFGRFANMIKVNALNPIANSLADLADDARLTIKYEVLDTIRYAAEPLTQFLFGDPNDDKDMGVIGSVVDKISTTVGDLRDSAINKIGTVVDKIVEPVGYIASNIVKSAGKIALSSMTMVPRMIKKGVDIVTSKVVKETTNIFKIIHGGLSKFFSPIANLGKHIFKSVTSGIGSVLTVGKGISDYIYNKASGVSDRLDSTIPPMADLSGKKLSFKERWEARKNQYLHDKEQAKIDSATRKQRSANEKFIYRYTKGQFAVDNEDARLAAIAAYNKRNPKNQILTAEDIKKKFKIGALDQEKNQMETGVGVGLSSVLGTANIKNLPWEGKTFAMLARIYDRMEGISDDINDSNSKKDDDSDIDTSKRDHTIKHDSGKVKKTASDIVSDIEVAGGIGKYLWNGIRKSAKQGKDSVIKAANKLKNKLGLPGHASGTSHAARIAVVGEEGPEIAVTSGGNTSIAPNGGGMPVFITGMSSFIREKFGKLFSIFKTKPGKESASYNDTVMDDGNIGNSVDEIRNRKEDAHLDELKAKALSDISKNSEESVEATVEHNSEWSEIFGKKGLITMGAVGLFLLAANWLRKNGDLAGILKNAVGGIVSGVKNIFGQFGFTSENKARTNGQSMGDALEGQIDRVGGSVQKLANGKVFSAADEFIYGDDGEVDHQSSANAKLIAKTGLVAGNKVYKFSKTSVGQLIGKGISKAGSAIGKGAKVLGEKAAPYASKTASAIASGVTSATKKGAGKLASGVSKVATKAANSSSLISKALSMLDDVLVKIVSVVNKKAGTKITTSIFSKVLSGLKTALAKGGSKVITKLGPLFAGKSVLSLIPLVNIAFIGISAVNGLTGAARLFQVNKEDVDWKMRIISGVIGGFSGTLPGAVVDVLNELSSEILGVDLLSSIAVMVYNAISSDEDDSKLETAQSSFKDEYKEYQEGAIEDSYKKAIENGEITSDTSIESYKAGVESGKYTAEYKSFADYNDSENKSLGGKIASGAASIVGSISGGIRSAGDIIMKSLGDISKKVISTPKTIMNSFNEAKDSASQGKPKIILNGMTPGNPLGWVEQMGSFYASIAGSAVGIFSMIGNFLKHPFKSIGKVADSFIGKFKDFFFGDDKKKTKSSNEKIKGGRGSSENGFAYYSQNDPRWSNVSYRENDGSDRYATIGNSGCGPAAMSMVASQMTGMDINPRQMARFAQATGNRDNTGTNWKFIDDSSNALGVHSTRSMKPSASYIKSQLNNGHPMILSGRSNGGRGAFTSDGHYVVAVGTDNNGNMLINDPRGKEYSGAYNIDDVASETGAAWSFGGRGGATIQNGAYYFSQNGQAWSGNALKGFPGATIGDSGCVMTSAAMGTSSLLGQAIDPGTFNSTYGNGNVNYTSWGSLGLSCQRYPSGGSQGKVSPVPSDAIISALQQHKPVMLLGQKERGNIYYDGGSTGPGTSHCVLATGLDSNGNIIVNDPWASSNERKKGQSFTLDQLNPLYWAQVISGPNGAGISGNLSTSGMSSSYTAAAKPTSKPTVSKSKTDNNASVSSGATSTTSGNATIAGSTQTNSSAPGEGEEQKDILGTVGNFFSSFASRAVNGFLTGNYDTDYSEVFNPTPEYDTSMTDDTSADATTGGRGTRVSKRKWSLNHGGGRGEKPVRKVTATVSTSDTNKIAPSYGGSNIPTNIKPLTNMMNQSRLDSDTSHLITNIIKLLTDIAANTLTTSQKLEYLKMLNNTLANVNVNNNTAVVTPNVSGKGNTATSVKAQRNHSITSSRNDTLANKIARAG